MYMTNLDGMIVFHYLSYRKGLLLSHSKSGRVASTLCMAGLRIREKRANRKVMDWLHVGTPEVLRRIQCTGEMDNLRGESATKDHSRAASC